MQVRHILLVGVAIEGGGAEQVIVDLALGLDRRSPYRNKMAGIAARCRPSTPLASASLATENTRAPWWRRQKSAASPSKLEAPRTR